MSEKKHDLWFKETERDFKAALALLDQQLYNLAVFHFVQAAEKAIKAILYLVGTRPWGHSITALLEEFEDLGNTVDDTIKEAGILLEPHYIDSRYPGDSDDKPPGDRYTIEIARSVKDGARIIMDFAKQEYDTWKADQTRGDD